MTRHGVGFQPNDARWRERLADVVAFREEFGFLPSQVSQAPLPERRMSYWLSSQRSDASAWALSVERKAWLDEALPGWQERQPPHRRRPPVES